MYNNFVNDYKQYNILFKGMELIFLNRTDADKILEDLLNGKIEITNQNDEYKQLKQISLVLMIIVINGRGLKSNSIFDLYGMQTRANSVSDDGNLCIYNAKRINEINSNIRSFIENKIIQIETQPSWKIGDFSEKNFTTTVFNYSNAKKEIYKNMTDKFYEEFNDLKDDILNYVDLENLSDIKSIMNKLASLNIAKFRNLYNHYEKMNDSENKMNEIEKLSNLAKFYQTTKNMLANEKIQGIKVNKYDSNELSISEIRIEIP